MSSAQGPVREPKCTMCGALYSAHTAGPCEWCGRHLEHHARGEQADCAAGKARMALARRPEDRNDLDRRALAQAVARGLVDAETAGVRTASLAGATA